jgi:hypothetical protein
VGGKLCLLLNRLGLIVGWSFGPANVYDTLFHPLVEMVKSRMVVLADQSFHAAAGDPPNLKLCQRGQWNDRMLVETVLSIMTVVSRLKQVRHRCWDYLLARLACLVTAVNLLFQWHGLPTDEQGFVHPGLFNAPEMRHLIAFPGTPRKPRVIVKDLSVQHARSSWCSR